jgi:hypothetical protein
MNATYTKTDLPNRFFLAILALPFGMILLLFAATGVLASLVMIFTPIGMALAPTWSVQLFYWKFESALDAWYLPIFGILLDLCLFHLVKSIARFMRQALN